MRALPLLLKFEIAGRLLLPSYALTMRGGTHSWRLCVCVCVCVYVHTRKVHTRKVHTSNHNKHTHPHTHTHMHILRALMFANSSLATPPLPCILQVPGAS